MTGAETERERVREKIAVALDVPTAAEALDLARRLEGRAGWLKIGLQLFTAAGAPLVSEMARSGQRVFLDLKLHDIPNTVASAAVEAVRMGAAMVNVHATGGIEMMRRASESVARESRRLGLTPPLLVAVTALTSLDDDDLAEIGLLGPARELVVRLSALAFRSGCDGVVCSPGEISAVRARCGKEFFIVAPGIRPSGAADSETGPKEPKAPSARLSLSPRPDDQKRVATPASALAAGADLIVVGRPVTASGDPAKAVEGIVDEIVACGPLPRGPSQ